MFIKYNISEVSATKHIQKENRIHIHVTSHIPLLIFTRK